MRDMDKRKVLLQINVCAVVKSTGRLTEQIGHLAIMYGFESYIAYGLESRNSESHLIKIGRKYSQFRHRILNRYFDGKGRGSYFATKKFIKELERINPDIIQMHNIHGNYLNIKLLFEYFAKSDRIVVWSMHDCWSITGHCSHFDLVRCEKWQTKCFNCPQKKPFSLDRSKSNYKFKKNLFGQVLRLFIVPTSKYLADVKKYSYLKSVPELLIYNGIDLEVFRPIDSELRLKYNLKDCFVMIGVATDWSPAKGLNDYIELAKRLDDEYKIIMVGVSPAVKTLLPNCIIAIERTDSQNELAQLYSMSDVVLNLSYQEAFGLTTVEGLACGTPTISYDRTACPELVKEDTGIVVEAGNIVRLIAAINTVKKNGKESYSKACRDWAVSDFNMMDRFKDYIDLYNDLLKEKG